MSDRAVDIVELVDGKVASLMSRRLEARAACVAVWSRWLVLASPGWVRWPMWRRKIHDAFAGAVELVAGGADVRTELLLLSLGGFDVEDDGSTAWQYLIDLVSALDAALEGAPIDVSLRATLLTFLGGTQNVLGNELATSNGGTVTQADVDEFLRDSPTWTRAVDFVRSL